MSDSDSDSDSENEDDNLYSYRSALIQLGDQEGDQGHKLFGPRQWLEETNSDLGDQKWSNLSVYQHLCTLYRHGLKKHHIDKRGSGCTESFMRVRKAWDTIKQRYQPPETIDLIHSESDEDEDDESSSDGEENSVEAESQQCAQSLVIGCEAIGSKRKLGSLSSVLQADQSNTKEGTNNSDTIDSAMDSAMNSKPTAKKLVNTEGAFDDSCILPNHCTSD